MPVVRQSMTTLVYTLKIDQSQYDLGQGAYPSVLSELTRMPDRYAESWPPEEAMNVHSPAPWLL